MNVQTFLEKFEVLADAPNAVATMRQIVLGRAVTGDLVAQDAQDESASKLVDSFRTQRDKLVASGKIRARAGSRVGADEQPYELPSSWAWVRLSEVGYELGQKVPDKRFTYIDVGSIDSDKGRVSDRVERLDPNDAPSRARKLLAKGTVIYSTVRPYLHNIAIVEHDFDPEPIASTAFGILHPFKGMDGRYLFYWLRGAPFTAYVEASMKGMAYPAINDEKFYNGFIALPPLAEQKRIVAKVDELMALCDLLEVQQAEREARHVPLARAALARFADAPTPTNLGFLFHDAYVIDPASIRTSVILLAMQGKLVKQNPSERMTEDVLKQASEKRGADELETSDERDLTTPVGDHEKPFALPPTWTWARLGGIATIKHGFAFPSDGFSSEPTRFVLTTPGSFYEKGGFRDRGKATKYYRGSVDPAFIFKPRDLIIPMTEQAAGLLGSPAFIPDDGKTYIHNQRVGKVEFHTSLIAPEFVFWFFNSDFFRGELARTCTGMKVRHTSPKRVVRVPIPVPPLPEQRRIVAKVNELMALLDQLEVQLAASHTAAEQLMEAVVAELTAAG